jgi:hypothetical protein
LPLSLADRDSDCRGLSQSASFFDLYHSSAVDHAMTRVNISNIGLLASSTHVNSQGQNTLLPSPRIMVTSLMDTSAPSQQYQPHKPEQLINSSQRELDRGLAISNPRHA